MRPTQHPSNTRVIGAPKGWDQASQPCQALAVTDQVVEGVPALVSFWQPTPDEVKVLAAGGTVALWVFGGGMPPVGIEVEPAP